MANIFVCYFTFGVFSYYEGLIKSLVECGNNVMECNIGDFKIKSEWGDYLEINKKTVNYLINKINNFNADFIISFNNSFPVQCIEKLDIPICVIDADNVACFFEKKFIKKNVGKYIFLGTQSNSKEEYEKFFGKKLKYLYWPGATSIKSKSIKEKKNINISYIGTNYLFLNRLIEKSYDNPMDIKDIIHIYNNFDTKPIYHFVEFRKKIYKTDDIEHDKKIYDYYNSFTLSGMKRIALLDSVCDLGLKLYGTPTWMQLVYSNLDLLRCYNNKKIVTLKDNQEIYNRSKISIDISHNQAINGFSWRVMDIMASSSCLLIERKNDFINLFGKYLSKETLNAIVYKDKYDLRNKVIDLLNNDKKREKCVCELNNAIENNGRWCHRFVLLGKFLNINLVNYEKLGKHKIVVSNEKKHMKKNKFLNRCFSKCLKKAKKFLAYLFLAFSEIPFISRIPFIFKLDFKAKKFLSYN